MLVRHDGFIARWLSYFPGPLHYVWERGWHYWKMASEEVDLIESDSPFFPSGSAIPQTILEDLCR